MTQAPSFFVPGLPAEVQEEVYADFARRCQRPVPDPGERVYSITYVHDREEWTATVGERLHGIRRQSTGSRRRRSPISIEQVQGLNDPATVLAIFQGNPFVVFTNAGGVRSAWENPFFVGSPRFTTFFSASP